MDAKVKTWFYGSKSNAYVEIETQSSSQEIVNLRIWLDTAYAMTNPNLEKGIKMYDEIKKDDNVALIMLPGYYNVKNEFKNLTIEEELHLLRAYHEVECLHALKQFVDDIKATKSYNEDFFGINFNDILKWKTTVNYALLQHENFRPLYDALKNNKIDKRTASLHFFASVKGLKVDDVKISTSTRY